jgi:hypothetical protein
MRMCSPARMNDGTSLRDLWQMRIQHFAYSIIYLSPAGGGSGVLY